MLMLRILRRLMGTPSLRLRAWRGCMIGHVPDAPRYRINETRRGGIPPQKKTCPPAHGPPPPPLGCIPQQQQCYGLTGDAVRLNQSSSPPSATPPRAGVIVGTRRTRSLFFSRYMANAARRCLAAGLKECPRVSTRRPTRWQPWGSSVPRRRTLSLQTCERG